MAAALALSTQAERDAAIDKIRAPARRHDQKYKEKLKRKVQQLQQQAHSLAQPRKEGS